ncbi:MAG: MATE family efflux transporter [Lachnospiraceae bacterium]|nr:MATE family efflux transporter [Lachnospiraceae bacterium]
MGRTEKKKYEIDMCNGPILKKMLLFAVPLMFSSILQLLFNAADIVVVGRFAGDDSLAAVGSTSSLINLLTNLFIGLSVGANVLVARYFGAKKEEDLKETVHTAMTLSILGGIVLTIIGMVGAPVILTWMQTPPEVLSLAVTYLRVYFVGMTAMMVYNFGSSILRAIGDTKRPLYFLTIAGVVNVALNLVFVIVFHWGVFGVGLATTISQVISAFFVLRCMMREQGGIRLDLKCLGINKSKLLQIMQIGIPAGFQGMLFSLSNVVIQSSVNSFGNIVVAGNSAASNIEGFVYVGMNAFYQAAISFMGQNVGAGKYSRVNKILLAAETCVIVIGLLLGNLVVLFAEPLLALYTDSAIVMEAGMVRLRMICTIYCLCGMMDVMVGALRGLGYSIAPMIVSLLGACVFRLIWIATIFQMEQFHRIETVYISYPISWTLTFLAHVVTFIIVRKRLKKRWGE